MFEVTESFKKITSLFSIIILSDMAYVQQICEGYSKRTLIGNWAEERQYTPQPFRENITKQPRPKDQAITCYDGSSFQRALPRLQRRNKWQTLDKVILDDGFKKAPSVMRAEYPNQQFASSYNNMKKPFDKNSASINPTSIHPHSEVKPNQVPYHIINKQNAEEVKAQRDVVIYGSDFRSTLQQHPPVEKYTNYVSQYKGRISGDNDTLRNRTSSQFMQTRQSAGNYRPVYPEQTVKPITTLYCQNKKDTDEKEHTGVQRSWVPSRDRALTYSMGRTAQQFKKAGQVQNDIQTNLNINTGVHNLHPKVIPDNFFRHTRSITVSNNKTPAIRP